MTKIKFFFICFMILQSCESSTSNEVTDSNSIVKEDSSIKSNSSMVNNDSLIINKLRKIYKESYKGKTVSELLNDTLVKGYYEYFYSDEPPGKLSALVLMYTRKIYLKIYFDELQYVERLNFDGDWPIEEIKKEKISHIEIEMHSY